jgi:hypothetical protein
MTGAYRGAVIGLLLAIGYDTSSQTATLEGGRAHLRFATVLLAALIGAGAGLLVAAFHCAAAAEAVGAAEIGVSRWGPRALRRDRPASAVHAAERQDWV